MDTALAEMKELRDVLSSWRQPWLQIGAPPLLPPPSARRASCAALANITLPLPFEVPSTPLTSMIFSPSTPTREYPDSPLLEAAHIYEADAWDDIRRPKRRTRAEIDAAELRATVRAESHLAQMRAETYAREQRGPNLAPNLARQNLARGQNLARSEQDAPPFTPRQRERPLPATPESRRLAKRSPKHIFAGLCKLFSPKRKIASRQITPLTPMTPRAARAVMLGDFSDYI